MTQRNPTQYFSVTFCALSGLGGGGVVVEPKENLRPSASNQRQSEPALSRPSGRVKGVKKGSGWGGRRLGAGAPRSNMNALKHGRRSERMAKVGMIFAANPKVRDALLAIADRWERKQMKADEVADYILAQILERGLKRGDGRLEEYLEETLSRRIDAKSHEENLD